MSNPPLPNSPRPNSATSNAPGSGPHLGGARPHPGRPTRHLEDAPAAAAADLEAYVERLDEMVSAAKTMPLSASIMVNKAEVEELVGAMHTAIPEEIRQARRILAERDQILEDAEDEADRVVRQAREERDRMMSRTEVVQTAEREADRIVAEAEEHARQIRLEAEDYVDARLANFEVVLQKTLREVDRGREKLQGTLHDDQLAGQPPEPEGPEVFEGQ